ncbi:hypothetical protein Pcinc_028884 [Petrolisthes cinctipes]|uniref:Uncharacterized protein n=1 Tax=Petrolisthes cinctipes TaxID=88211 RepID=A0AAE1F1J5_PETCI|nr:hypothetical protein Pcinc_028884 [Petrolisthes cinctipes]
MPCPFSRHRRRVNDVMVWSGGRCVTTLVAVVVCMVVLVYERTLQYNMTLQKVFTLQFSHDSSSSSSSSLLHHQPLRHHSQTLHTSGKPIEEHSQPSQPLRHHPLSAKLLKGHSQSYQSLRIQTQPLPNHSQPLPNHFQSSHSLPNHSQPLPNLSQHSQPLPNLSQHSQPLPNLSQHSQPLPNHSQSLPNHSQPLPNFSQHSHIITSSLPQSPFLPKQPQQQPRQQPQPRPQPQQHPSLDSSCYEYEGVWATNKCCDMLHYAGGDVLVCLRATFLHMYPGYRNLLDDNNSKNNNNNNSSNENRPWQHWALVGDSHLRYIFDALTQRLRDYPPLQYRIISHKNNSSGGGDTNWSDAEDFLSHLRFDSYKRDIQIRHTQSRFTVTWFYDPLLLRLPYLLTVWLKEEVEEQQKEEVEEGVEGMQQEVEVEQQQVEEEVEQEEEVEEGMQQVEEGMQQEQVEQEVEQEEQVEEVEQQYRPSFLVINSGLHWLSFLEKAYTSGLDNNATLVLYQDQLNHLTPILGRFATHTPTVFKLLDDVQAADTNPKSEKVISRTNLAHYNQVTVEALRGTGVTVWDSTLPLSLGYSHQCSVHPRTSINYWWKCHDKRHVGYVLVEQYVDMLLNHACNSYLLVQQHIHRGHCAS